MENNYAQVNVLYANARIVENDNVNLQKIADSIADYFYERGDQISNVSVIILNYCIFQKVL